MDTIGDFLTIVRNASSAKNKFCLCFSSNIRVEIAKILKREGYIQDFTETKNEKGFKILKIALKYVNNAQPAIHSIKRISKPGCRIYFPYQEIPRVLGGYGTSILTTSKGLKTGNEARKEKLGGELLCQVS
ncbi:MAG: 30S ribosomal protein S8 [Verrucomicrobia bacterium]|nr:MAG: 30S ribosomal protein S8 [Verrucomicrobiota bacterium]